MGSIWVDFSDKLWWSGLDRHYRGWILDDQKDNPRDSRWGSSNQKDNPRADSWGWNNQRGSPRDNSKGGG